MTSSTGGARPIRVLHLRDSPWVDGPGRTILETATRIDRSLIDYHVGAFVSNPSDPHPLVNALRERGLPVHAIPDPGGIGPEVVNHIVALVLRFNIDVLHTSEFRSNVLGLLCRRRIPVKLVSTAHGWIANDVRGRLYALMDRVLLRCFDQVILVSRAMRRRVPGWWIPDSKVTVIHNALAVEAYGRNLRDLPRRTLNADGEIRLLNVGRLSPEKGQVDLLRAVAAVSSDYPSVRLWFAGVGPLEATLRRESARLGIQEKVRFLGFVSDMPSLYAQIDLVIQSSITEGMPNVMLEVAHMGVPVVATAVGGTEEIVEHGVSGWIVAPRSPGALEAGIRSFLQAPERFALMANKGKRRVEAGFSFESRTEAQARVYTGLV